MIGTSAGFQAVVSHAHEHTALVEVVRDGAVVRTLAVHSGSVDADRSGRILRRFDCTVTDADGELTPAGIRDLLAPFGTELRLYRGVRVPHIQQIVNVFDTQTEWDLGTRSNTQADAGGDLTLGLT